MSKTATFSVSGQNWVVVTYPDSVTKSGSSSISLSVYSWFSGTLQVYCGLWGWQSFSIAAGTSTITSTLFGLSNSYGGVDYDSYKSSLVSNTVLTSSDIKVGYMYLPMLINMAGEDVTVTGASPDSNVEIELSDFIDVWVYNSSGVPKRATNIYVYNSSGVPKEATAFYVYNSSGEPKNAMAYG